MTRWAPNLYRREGIAQGISLEIINSSLKNAHISQNAGFPAILTLKHLAVHTNVPYVVLRNIVSRRIEPYRTFSIRKYGGGRRNISVPSYHLMNIQRWIDKFILSKIPPNPHSYAFHPGQSILACAEQHLGCKWLVKVDLRHFFESLSEIQVYHIFKEIGYNNLISFEMARLCTKVSRWGSRKYRLPNWTTNNTYSIHNYNNGRIGHLPQGAPTSPKLANLIVRKLDLELAEIFEKDEFVYTRYADDIAVSTSTKQFSIKNAHKVINSIYSKLPEFNLRPNPQKVQILHPGSRKVILGLLVDGDKIRLSKSFRNKLECHLYYINKDCFQHCDNRHFDSVLGLKNYINGLLAFARQVDSEYVDKLLRSYGKPVWPV